MPKLDNFCKKKNTRVITRQFQKISPKITSTKNQNQIFRPGKKIKYSRCVTRHGFNSNENVLAFAVSLKCLLYRYHFHSCARARSIRQQFFLSLDFLHSLCDKCRRHFIVWHHCFAFPPQIALIVRHMHFVANEKIFDLPSNGRRLSAQQTITRALDVHASRMNGPIMLFIDDTRWRRNCRRTKTSDWKWTFHRSNRKWNHHDELVVSHETLSARKKPYCLDWHHAFVNL